MNLATPVAYYMRSPELNEQKSASALFDSMEQLLGSSCAPICCKKKYCDLRSGNQDFLPLSD